MKKALLVSIALFSFGYIFGQIHVAPILFDTTVDEKVLDIQFDSDIQNIGSSGILINWERTIITMPKAWDNYIFTGVNCYIPEVSSGSFTLKAGESTELLTHFNPNLIPGCADVFVTLTDANNPTDIDTVVYKMCAGTVSSHEVDDPDSIVLYQNPVKDHFQLFNGDNVSKLIISDLSGRLIKSYNTNQNVYNTEDISSGLYILQVYGTDQKLIKTMRIVIQKY